MKFSITSRAFASKLKYFCWILLFILISLLVGLFVFKSSLGGIR